MSTSEIKILRLYVKWRALGEAAGSLAALCQCCCTGWSCTRVTWPGNGLKRQKMTMWEEASREWQPLAIPADWEFAMAAYVKHIYHQITKTWWGEKLPRRWSEIAECQICGKWKRNAWNVQCGGVENLRNTWNLTLNEMKSSLSINRQAESSNGGEMAIVTFEHCWERHWPFK